MYKERQIILNSEFYKIVSGIIEFDDIDNIITKDWIVFAKYENKRRKKVVDAPALDSHKEDHKEVIGIFRFSGKPQNGRVVLSYEKKVDLKPIYYMELLRKICEWAFSQKDLYSIQMSAPDVETREMLLKLSFKEEDGCFVLHKEKETQMLTCLGIGLALGLTLGGCFDIELVGSCIGLVAGYFTGRTLDNREKIHRRIVEKRNSE